MTLSPLYPWTHRTRRPSHDDRDWRRCRAFVFRRDGGVCQHRPFGIGPKCGRAAEHIDHRHPLKWAGSNSPTNLQALCARHNLAKGAHVPAWWLAARAAYTAAWAVAAGLALGFAWAAYTHGLATVAGALARQLAK